MRVIENEINVYLDVDDTLVMWGKIKRGQRALHVTDPYDGTQHTLRPHIGHIKVLKDRKARGATIHVWSASGWQWALAVVKALKLEGYVDYVQSKPTMYVDDLQAEEILGERLYLGADSQYGT
jgi:predicted phosphatase